MTQRTIHKAGAKSNGHGEQNAFERWLLRPLDGARRPRDGSEAQQKMIRQNLERAAEAPFSVRTRLKLMEKVFSTPDPEKALSILRGLCGIVESTGSYMAKEIYGRLSSEWLKDRRISRNEPQIEARGHAFILRKAMEVPTERSVAFPPRIRLCGWEDQAYEDDVEDVFLG
ncbi:MAG: hypothetical protein NTY83_03185 [Candidatus Micrarchaeota archaeon]|nr:hypothetical protein [Candidatus Micrarchaeota archaeon]